MAQFNENLELLNNSGITVQLKNEQAQILAGGNGVTGEIHLHDPTNKTYSNLNGNATLTMGGEGAITGLVLSKTVVTLQSFKKSNTVRLNGNANLWMGGNGDHADIVLFPKNGDNKTLNKATIHLDAQAAEMVAGGNGTFGNILLKNGKNKDQVRLGADANLWMGGNGYDADIVLFPTNGDNKTLSKATIHLDAQHGDMFLGGNGVKGEVALKDDNNNINVRLKGDANLWMGGNGADGDIFLFEANVADQTVGNASIHLNGDSGNIRCNDVIIPGADFAEDFDIHDSISETLEAGTVMVLGRDGKLLESTKAFDRKVAGVVSGAGRYKVGITLDKQPDVPNRKPIALSGKVMCKIDASYGSIEVGDLITTSPRKGYAMKADDPFKSFGAVIGKALADFRTGDGLLPILVALQ